MRRVVLISLCSAVVACAAEPAGPAPGDPGDPDDPDPEEPGDYWDETSDDDGSQPGAMDGERVTVSSGPTDDPELVKLLPVGRSEDGATRKIVLRLAPNELPRLVAGDRLFVPAEVQVTTRCDIGQTAPGCAYNPNVRAQLLLTGRRDDTSGEGPSKIIATQTQSCTKADHHCMFVFTPSTASATLGDLPCMADASCTLNLVMWAWHPDARASGDTVIVGANEGNFLDNGLVEQDRARLLAVRERDIDADDRRRRETTGGGEEQMNLAAEEELIYSHRLADNLVPGEQFVIEAKVVTTVSSRARFSTQMFLTKDPRATSGGRFEKVAPGELNEHNGVNCTEGTSPCTTRKVAVFRVVEAVNGPVYVNLIARSEVPGPGTSDVRVKRGEGWLRSVRYRAALGQ